MQFRPQRVSGLIQEELSHLIRREMEFPGALVTITEVIVDRKLDNAEVMVSIVPEKFEGSYLKLLNDKRRDLQHLLLRKINIKPMPLIRFEIDRGAGNAAKIEKLLSRTEEEVTKD